MNDGEDVEMCIIDFNKVLDADKHRFLSANPANLATFGVFVLVVGWNKSYVANRTCQVHI